MLKKPFAYEDLGQILVRLLS